MNITFYIDKHGQIHLKQEITGGVEDHILSRDKTVELARVLYPIACADIVSDLRIKTPGEQQEYLYKLCNSLRDEARR